MSSWRRGSGWSSSASRDSRRGCFRSSRAMAWPDSTGVATLCAGGMTATVSPVSLSQAARPKVPSRNRPIRPLRIKVRSLITGLLGQNMGDAQARAGEIGTGRLLDIFRRYRFQCGEVLVHQAPGQANRFQHANGGGLLGDGVALVDQSGDDLCADALKFLGRRRCLFELFQLCPEGGLDLFEGVALLRIGRGAEDEQAVTAGVGVVPGGGTAHQFLAALQLP